MSESTTHMSRVDILDTIYTLSLSQGFYSRLVQSLNDLADRDPEQYDLYMNHLQQQHFKDPVDLVMYFEC